MSVKVRVNSDRATLTDQINVVAGTPGTTITKTLVDQEVKITVAASAGGPTNHATLTHLDWLSSGHTGSIAGPKIAGFDASAAAVFYVVGTDIQAWDTDLDGIAAVNANGIFARTSAGNFANRTFSWTGNGLVITDGNGVSGNPTIALANDVAAVEALSGTGLAVRTGSETWTNRTIAVSGTGISIANGDGVSGNPTITVAPSTVVNAAGRYTRTVIASQTGGDGYTNVSIPSDCEWVAITIAGPGASGRDGVTGDNTANRNGGNGGGSGGWTSGIWHRRQLPSTIYCRPGLGQIGNATVQSSVVEYINSGYVSSSINNAQYVIAYAQPGSLTSGGSAALLQLAHGLKAALNLTVLAGTTAATATSGHPTDLSSFGGTTNSPMAPGCAGGGKTSAGPTASAGGGFAAMGPFSARAGGAATGADGSNAIFGGGDSGGFTSSASTVDQLSWAYSGTGGGANTAGKGGNGGNGIAGSGGGGGGAGTSGTGSGGNGGDGWIIVETW